VLRPVYYCDYYYFIFSGTVYGRLTKQIYIVGHLHTYEACVYSPVSCCFYGPAEPTIEAKNEEKIGF